MSISVKVEKDSINKSGKRLTTFVLKYPRFIHSELMTHRVFSRNASSSRAIPVKKLIASIKEDPAIPIHWGQNQPGMQAYQEHTHKELGEELWLNLLDQALVHASALADLGFHKQVVNRVLEPWSHIHVVLTATEFSNWFGLRDHHAAQPEIQALAREMREEYEKSTPTFLEEGEWHLPFISTLNGEFPKKDLETKIIQSVARCARVSYMNHEGKSSSVEEDLKLYDRLLGSQPIHASPAEHQAMAIGDPTVRSGNLIGWIQYRKTLIGENIQESEDQK